MDSKDFIFQWWLREKSEQKEKWPKTAIFCPLIVRVVRSLDTKHNEKVLEHYYEQGLEMGMTEEEAEEYAYEKFDGGQ